MRAIVCYGCREEGHYQAECPRAAMECYFCHDRGHRVSHCPKKRGFRGSRGRGPVRETDRSSSEAGPGAALPPPPRVFQLQGLEDDYPDLTPPGMVFMYE